MCGGELSLKPNGDRTKIFNVGHIRPRRNGGPNMLSNYLPICAYCNKKRGHMSPEEIRKMLDLGRTALGRKRVG